ncbi:MAG: type transport system permease protein [Gaiellaceae bacterium]|jgi:ABC-type transport system involved in multi-copper enzyme maturation permease subunit|nr:type transport system permease protein [Gaiellaceae bacterium]
MIDLVRAELLKIRTVRSWYVYLGLIVLFSAIAVAADTGSSTSDERSTLSFQVGLVQYAGIATLFAILLGITIVTTEFRHGTVTPAFLVEPRRERVLAAKVLAATIVALFFDLLWLAVVAAVGLTWLSIIGADIHLVDGEIAKAAAETLLTVVLWALMGIAIGSAVHSQVAALVGTLVWIFVLENLLWGLFALLDIDGAVAYLPFRALDAADGTGGERLLSYGAGIAVSLAWIASIGAAGLFRTLRRDIT